MNDETKKDEVWERVKRDGSTVYGRPIFDVFLEVMDKIERRHLLELPPQKRRAVNSEARAYAAGTEDELAEAIKDGASGEYALKRASDLGNLGFVEKLVGINPALRLDWPLWGASSKGHEEVAKFLASKGAKDFDWAIQGALDGGHAKIAGWLIDKAKEMGRQIDIEYALYLAVMSGKLESVRLCVNKGAKDLKEPLDAAKRRLIGHERRLIIDFLESQIEKPQS